MNKELKTLMERNNFDLIVSFSPQTRLWLAKINTSAGYLFIDRVKATLLIDGRYIEMAKQNAKNVSVELLSAASLKEYTASQKPNRIGIEGDYMTVDEMNNVKRWFPTAELVPFSAAKLRMIKTPEEIKLMQTAADIALKALAKVKPLIKPGITEKAVDAMLEKAIRDEGGEKGSFDAIIASGTRSSLPHGRASDKVINNNEIITIDFGAVYKGYCSDITRTWVIGDLQDDKLKDIVSVLTEAQKRGVAAVKPGVTTLSIDKVCRDYITEKGYGQFFTHSTGHGLGIDVHELPNVTANPALEVVLEPGMVITVEPGIYIENLGGIRIEDDVLVTENGHQVLSNYDKNSNI